MNIPERATEVAEALAALHGALTLQPDDVKEMILFTLVSMTFLAGASKQGGMSDDHIRVVLEPSFAILHYVGVSKDEAHILFTAVCRDYADMMS